MLRNLSLFALLTAALLAGASPAVAQTSPPVGSAAKKALGTVKKKASADALFDRADADHDGKVSREEFRKAVASLPILKVKPPMADKLFAALDSNKDGFLTKAEIKQLPHRLRGLIT